MLNAGGDEGDDLVVPPTIQALLAARIDRLETGERHVLECAAVQGRQFDRDAVVALVAGSLQAELGAHLLSLVRRQFIRPVRGGEPGSDAFSFVHSLVRDAAHTAIPKERRAELHVRLADHLEQNGEPGEVVGHHLAEAVSYRRELGQDEGTTKANAARGAALLSAGGRRAYGIGDDRAATKLLERALELTVPEGPDALRVRLDLARALSGTDRLEEALELNKNVLAGARDLGDAALEHDAELGIAFVRGRTESDMLMSELVSVSERAFPVLEHLGDEAALARAWWLVHWARFRTGRVSESIEAAERALVHAHRVGYRRETLRALSGMAMSLLWGPTPVPEAWRRCDELVARADGAKLVEAFALRVRGGLASMTGDFEAGRDFCRRSVEIYEELGHPISAIGVSSELQRVERQAGRLDVAGAELRAALDRLHQIGDLGYVSWVAAALARVLADQGELAEARELARYCRDELQRDHAYAQITALLVEAVALVGEGRPEHAEAPAQEALARVEQTDILDLHGDVLLAVADVDRAQGRSDEAAARVGRAIALYERKGDVVSAARARDTIRSSI